MGQHSTTDISFCGSAPGRGPRSWAVGFGACARDVPASLLARLRKLSVSAPAEAVQRGLLLFRTMLCAVPHAAQRDSRFWLPGGAWWCQTEARDRGYSNTEDRCADRMSRREEWKAADAMWRELVSAQSRQARVLSVGCAERHQSGLPPKSTTTARSAARPCSCKGSPLPDRATVPGRQD